MDCPAEEQLIRMRLEGLPNIKSLDFDISKRELDVFHTGTSDEILTALQSLNLDTSHVRSIESELQIPKTGDDRKLLWIVLIINFSFFVLEMLTGLISRSMGLIADSLDMLADAFTSLGRCNAYYFRRGNNNKVLVHAFLWSEAIHINNLMRP